MNRDSSEAIVLCCQTAANWLQAPQAGVVVGGRWRQGETLDSGHATSRFRLLPGDRRHGPAPAAVQLPYSLLRCGSGGSVLPLTIDSRYIDSRIAVELAKAEGATQTHILHLLNLNCGRSHDA